MKPALWKIACEEHKYPGLWQHWFRSQQVAVGWPPKAGYHLEGETKGGNGWIRARKALLNMNPGDRVLVTLRGHRVAKIGTILTLEVNDGDWNPFVPKGPGSKYGEKGRRIEVKWDLELGPDNRDMVVRLPSKHQLSSGELRPTISKVRSRSINQVTRAMADETNWIPLWAHFDYEKALSGYIAAYPHRLEDGLLPYPNERLRERVFSDGTRLDVLLMDKDQRPVVVECKQGSPSVENIRQLRGYMRHVHEFLRQKPRGMLVHGGARKLGNDIRQAASSTPRIEIVQHRLEVVFSISG